MVVWAYEAGLRHVVERELDLLPLLQRVARRAPEKPVDPAEASDALAAAECVAAAAGRPPADPPDLLLRWLSAHPSAPSVPLMAAAIKALDRLRGEAALPPGAPLDDIRSRLSGR
ncbi:MAG TPA: DUF4259 domain-containing protein [Planctomycetota bacterium]